MLQGFGVPFDPVFELPPAGASPVPRAAPAPWLQRLSFPGDWTSDRLCSGLVAVVLRTHSDLQIALYHLV